MSSTDTVSTKFTQAIIDKCIAHSNNKPAIVARRFGPDGGYAIAVALSGHAFRIVVSVAVAPPPPRHHLQYQIIQVMELPASEPKRINQKIQELVALYGCAVWTFSSEQATKIARLTTDVTIRIFDWAAAIDTGPVTLEDLWKWFVSVVQSGDVVLSGVEDGKPGQPAKLGQPARMLIHHMRSDGDTNNEWGVVPFVAMSLLAARSVYSNTHRSRWNTVVFGTPSPPEPPCGRGRDPQRDPDRLASKAPVGWSVGQEGSRGVIPGEGCKIGCSNLGHHLG